MFSYDDLHQRDDHHHHENHNQHDYNQQIDVHHHHDDGHQHGDHHQHDNRHKDDDLTVTSTAIITVIWPSTCSILELASSRSDPPKNCPQCDDHHQHHDQHKLKGTVSRDLTMTAE